MRKVLGVGHFLESCFGSGSHVSFIIVKLFTVKYEFPHTRNFTALILCQAIVREKCVFFQLLAKFAKNACKFRQKSANISCDSNMDSKMIESWQSPYTTLLTLSHQDKHMIYPSSFKYELTRTAKRTVYSTYLGYLGFVSSRSAIGPSMSSIS